MCYVVEWSVSAVILYHLMLFYNCTYSLYSVCIADRPSSSALSTVPSNTTVLRGKTLSLICSTDANPLNSVTYHFYFNDSYIRNSSSGVFNVTVEADGLYTCVPINTVGTGQNATVSVNAVGKSVHNYSKDLTLHSFI